MPYNNLGTLLQTAGDLAEAESCFREALEPQPATPGSGWQPGAVLQAQGRLPEAQAAFEPAIKNCAQRRESVSRFRPLPASAGRSAGRDCLLQEVGRLDPASYLAHYQLGPRPSSRGELYEAAAEYAQTIRMAPKFADAHY